MFGGIKDSLTSSAAKSFLASRIDRYAQVTDLRIHSRNRTIVADLMLKGEETPVQIEARYRIGGGAGEHTITVEQVAASRPWLHNLLEDVVVGKPQPIPSMALLALGGVES